MINYISAKSVRNVTTLLSDNGTEFLNNNVKYWLAEHCISHIVSTPYVKQQNGAAGVAINAIIEAARIQLLRSSFPNGLWAEACGAATYALNRLISLRSKDKTRYEIYFGHPPDVANFRVFEV